jgi:hypothetical protein
MQTVEGSLLLAPPLRLLQSVEEQRPWSPVPILVYLFGRNRTEGCEQREGSFLRGLAMPIHSGFLLLAAGSVGRNPLRDVFPRGSLLDNAQTPAFP